MALCYFVPMYIGWDWTFHPILGGLVEAITCNCPGGMGRQGGSLDVSLSVTLTLGCLFIRGMC